MRYTLARRLGLVPQSLFGGSPVFLWRDEAKFKNLSVKGIEEDALTSFGVSLGRILVNSTLAGEPLSIVPLQLRDEILSNSRFVDFRSILALAWSHGTAVVQAKILPTKHTGMHAMAVRIGERFVIIVGRKYSFPSQLAYVIAHELGHCFLGHLSNSAALVDMADPIGEISIAGDDEENAANRFALALLTGSESPNVASSTLEYSPTQLANAVRSKADAERIDPGVLALCLGHTTGRWPQTMGALKIIEERADLSRLLNSYALRFIDRERISYESALYLEKVLGESL